MLLKWTQKIGIYKNLTHRRRTGDLAVGYLYHICLFRLHIPRDGIARTGRNIAMVQIYCGGFLYGCKFITRPLERGGGLKPHPLATITSMTTFHFHEREDTKTGKRVLGNGGGRAWRTRTLAEIRLYYHRL